MADQNPIDQKTWDERMVAFHERMEAGIAKQGYSVVNTAVEATVAGGHIPMSYTVGLTSEGLPELVMLSVPHDMAPVILGEAVAKLRAGTAPTNVPVEGTCNFPVFLIEVSEKVAGDNLVIAFQRAKRLGQSPSAFANRCP